MNPAPTMAVIDIETGGFSKQKNGLCEIGMLLIDDTGTIHAQHVWLIKPYPRPESLQETPGQLVSYKPDAMQINGLSVEQLENDGHEAGYVANFLHGICKVANINTIIGHNAKAFDLPWLEEFMNRFGPGCPFTEVIDTLIIAKDKHPGLPSYKLGELVKHFGLDKIADHTAMGDNHATLELYKRLKGIGTDHVAS